MLELQQDLRCWKGVPDNCLTSILRAIEVVRSDGFYAGLSGFERTHLYRKLVFEKPHVSNLGSCKSQVFCHFSRNDSLPEGSSPSCAPHNLTYPLDKYLCYRVSCTVFQPRHSHWRWVDMQVYSYWPQ